MAFGTNQTAQANGDKAGFLPRRSSELNTNPIWKKCRFWRTCVKRCGRPRCGAEKHTQNTSLLVWGGPPPPTTTWGFKDRCSAVHSPPPGRGGGGVPVECDGPPEHDVRDGPQHGPASGRGGAGRPAGTEQEWRPLLGGGGTGEEGSDGKEGGLVSLSLALTLTPIRFQFAKVDPASSQRRISQENAPRPWLIDDFGPASWGSTSGEGRQPVQRARGDRHGWKPLPPGLGPRGGGGAET